MMSLCVAQLYVCHFAYLHSVDDPCDAAPCANDGTCNRTGLTDFSCVCEGNWGGATCDGEVLHYTAPALTKILTNSVLSLHSSYEIYCTSFHAILIYNLSSAATVSIVPV